MSTPQTIMANRIIGKDILLYVDVNGSPMLVAGQREGGIDISRESVDLTTKDDWVVAGEVGAQGTGMRLFKPSFGTWKATLGGIITYDATGADLLTDAVLDATQVTITVAVGTRTFKGLCNINSFNKTGAMAGEATYTADLQGCGALVVDEGAVIQGIQVIAYPVAGVGTIASLTIPTGGTYVANSCTVSVNGIPLLVKVGDGSTTPGWDVAPTASGVGGTLSFAGQGLGSDVDGIDGVTTGDEVKVTYNYTV
jgi:predicted secreted protein